jgi:hypothetical protein
MFASTMIIRNEMIPIIRVTNIHPRERSPDHCMGSQSFIPIGQGHIKPSRTSTMLLYLIAMDSDWIRSEMYASRQAGERVGDEWFKARTWTMGRIYWIEK